MIKRVGVFAGTFDPVHEGHLAFAQTALDAGLEKVWFLVEPRPRRKQGVRALEHRRAMVGLAIENQPKFGQIVLEQARFTAHETLPVLQARFKGHKIVLLFGDDVLSHIADWPDVEKLTRSVEFLIAVRKDGTEKVIQNMDYLAKSRGLRFQYECITAAHPEVSSSKLRLAIKKDQTSVTLPTGVLKYIQDNRLYISSDISS